MSDKDKEKDFESAFNDAYDLWYPWISEAHTDFKHVVDHPWTAADIVYFMQENREVNNFNLTRRVVKLITGYERRNRLALKIGPAEGEDDKVASQLTGLVMPLMENQRGYEIVSDAFEVGALITGLNLVEPYLDRNGRIKFSRKGYNKCLLDPHFTQRDLSDCGHIIIHEEGMLTSDVQSLVPGKDNLIAEYAKTTTESGASLPFSAYRGRGRDEGKRCNYSAFWQQKLRKARFIGNRRTKQFFEWKSDKEELDALLNQYPLQLVSWTEEKETVELECYVNGRLVWNGPDPNKIDEYPFIAIMGFWYPDYDDMSKKLQGIVRPIRGPQRELSKRLSKIIDILDSQMASGIVAEENALVNPDDIHTSGQGKGLLVKEGAIAGQKIIFRDNPGDVQPGLLQLNQTLMSIINEIAGINDSMFGNDELNAQMSGYLMKLRQGAGLVALQDLFDNLRFSKKQLGFKLIKLIQANYNSQRVERILNEPVAEGFYKTDLAQYDVVPQEGVLTETQRQMFYLELINAKNQGAPISWRMIFENAPIQMKQKLLEEIGRQEQQEAAGQQELLKEKQLLDRMREAKIAADMGRGVERQTQAEENRADKVLARVKTATEIQKLKNQDVFGLLDRIIALETLNVNARKTAMTRR